MAGLSPLLKKRLRSVSVEEWLDIYNSSPGGYWNPIDRLCGPIEVNDELMWKYTHHHQNDLLYFWVHTIGQPWGLADRDIDRIPEGCNNIAIHDPVYKIWVLQYPFTFRQSEEKYSCHIS